MSKRAAGLITVVLMAAIAAYASDPWKDKDPQSWDEKDVQKILQDSPWSHQVLAGISGGGAQPSTVKGTGNGGYSGTGPENIQKSAGTSGAGSTAPSRGIGSQTYYTFSWISARTIREAQARRRELGGISPDIARRDLVKPADDFEVMVAGSDMTALSKESEEDLKAQTFLILKSTKAKISPSHVILQGGPTARLEPIIFVFEKKLPSGEPTFAPDEKGVDFVTQTGKTRLKVSFDFIKMRDKQGLDL
jgi:hypothetical protein